MFREGLQIIKNDVGELNINYSVNNANYGWFLSEKANKYNEAQICTEKAIYISHNIFGKNDKRFRDSINNYFIFLSKSKEDCITSFFRGFIRPLELNLRIANLNSAAAYHFISQAMLNKFKENNLITSE